MQASFSLPVRVTVLISSVVSFDCSEWQNTVLLRSKYFQPVDEAL